MTDVLDGLDDFEDEAEAVRSEGESSTSAQIELRRNAKADIEFGRVTAYFGERVPKLYATGATPQDQVEDYLHKVVYALMPAFVTDRNTAFRYRDEVRQQVGARWVPAQIKHDGDQFYIYEPAFGTWTPDPGGAVVAALFHLWADHAIWRAEKAISYVRDAADVHAATHPQIDVWRKEVETALGRWKVRLRSATGLRDAMTMLATEPGVFLRDGAEAFDKTPHWLPVRNGVVDLRTGQLYAHSPDFMVTRALKVTYEPEAECPQFETYLDSCFAVEGYHESAAALRRMLGYSITGSVAEQVFALHHGPRGRNGKSVLMGIMQTLLGKYVKVSTFDEFVVHAGERHSTGLADLAGARMIQVGEGNNRQFMNESLIKSISGADPITARRMRENERTFLPTGKLHLTTNELPRFQSQGEALWDRVFLVTWPRYFAADERDRGLQARIEQNELEGVLALLVREAIAWFALNAEGKTGLIWPARMAVDVAAYKAESSPLAGFIPGEYELCKVGDAMPQSKDELWIAYQQWCDVQGVDKPKNGIKTFNLMVATAGGVDGGRVTVRNGPSSRKVSVWSNIRPQEDDAE